MNPYNPWKLVDHYLSPIAHLFEIEGCNEISVNRYDEILIKRHGKYEHVKERFESEDTVSALVSQIANALQQPIDDESHPILDARMPDGTRVCGVLYPVSSKGTSVSFRIFPKK